jgi:hypothetical protein
VLHTVPRRRYRIVDVIGAADAFLGAYVAATSRGLAVPQALLWAHAGGCLTTMKRGAQDSMARLRTLQRFLELELRGPDAPAELATTPEEALGGRARALLQPEGYLGQRALHLAAVRAWAADLEQVVRRIVESRALAAEEEKGATFCTALAAQLVRG